MRVVVTATGTEVGKTHIAVALVLAWRSCGVAARGLKPIESGVGPVPPPAALDAAEDGARLSAASASPIPSMFHVEHSPRPATLPAPPPYRFNPPVSPHLAARLSGTRIDFARIRAWVDAHAGPVVVETAGGLFSPLAPAATNWDLVRALEPAKFVLVAPDRIGVLHELTATLGFARSLGRVPDAIVLSACAGTDPSSGTNAQELARTGIARPAALFPRAAVTAAPTLSAARSLLRALGALPPADVGQDEPSTLEP
jgi:dethiobiotin synthetase